MGKQRRENKEKASLERRQGKDAPRRWVPGALLFGLVALTVVSYFRSLHGPLVLDDSIYIDPQRMGDFFRRSFFRFRSIAELSFSLNYFLAGMNLFAFRATNLFFHVVTGMLACYLTYITLAFPRGKGYRDTVRGIGPFYISLAVAALFLLHPIQTSTVNYLTQRMAIMAAMFSFAGLIFYAKGAVATGRESWLFIVLSAVSFVLAIFSKENAIMVLLMLPLYDFMLLSAFEWKEFRKRFAGLFAVTLILVLIMHFSIPSLEIIKKISAIFLEPNQSITGYGWAGVDIQWTPKEYLLTELRVVARYLVLIFFPAPWMMVFDHANAYPISKSLFSPVSTFLSLLFFLSLLVGVFRFGRRYPLAAFGILWYLITISLESFIALGLDPYFEHRNYLPGFGLFLAAASFLRYGKGEKKREMSGGSGIFQGFGSSAIPVLVVTVLLCVLTFARNGVWEDDAVLWKDVVDKSPDNPRALIAVSSIYLKEGRFREAEEYITRGGKMPTMSASFRKENLMNRASLYSHTGRKREAVSVLTELLSEKTLHGRDRGNVYFQLGEILRQEGKLPEARGYLDRALDKNPSHAGALTSLGLLNQSLKQFAEAEVFFNRAIVADPQQIVPYIGLGDVYFTRGDREKAEKYYNEAMVRTSGMPKEITKKVFLNIAQLKLARKKTDEAIGLFRKITETVPDFYPPYLYLGDIYLEKGDLATALAYFEKALSLRESFLKDDPNVILIDFNLGIIYAARGETQRATKSLNAFLNRAEGDVRLKAQVAKAKTRMVRMKDGS